LRIVLAVKVKLSYPVLGRKMMLVEAQLLSQVTQLISDQPDAEKP
jgi:hypothetical protein